MLSGRRFKNFLPKIASFSLSALRKVPKAIKASRFLLYKVVMALLIFLRVLKILRSEVEPTPLSIPKYRIMDVTERFTLCFANASFLPDDLVRKSTLSEDFVQCDTHIRA